MVIKLLAKQVDMNNIHLLPEKETKSIEIAMDGCLESISPENRVIFMRRYWFCDTYAEIAARYGISERKVRHQIQGIRAYMCDYLGLAWGSFGINYVDAKFIREAENVVSLREKRVFLRDFRSMLNNLMYYLLGRFLSFPRHA